MPNIGDEEKFQVYANLTSDESNANATDAFNINIVEDIIPPVLTIDSPETKVYRNINVLFSVNSSDDSYNGFIAPNLDESLVSWWRMDEVFGSTVIDYMGRNDGIAVGTFQTDASVYGKAFSFDGNDYIKVADDPSLDITNELTLSAWINIDRYINYGKVVIKRHVNTNNPWELYGIDMGYNNPFFRFFISNSSAGSWTAAFDNSHILDYDRWYHVVGTYNGSLMSLYVDGILIDTTETDMKIGENDEPLTIGGRGTGLGYIDGLLNEVMIFNRGLSYEEVLALYNATKMSFSSDLSEGSHSYTAFASDLAGNLNQDTLSFSIDTSIEIGEEDDQGEDEDGGGNGGVVTCYYNWTCGDWSECENNIQTRECINEGTCRGIANKPDEIQDCEEKEEPREDEQETISEPEKSLSEIEEEIPVKRNIFQKILDSIVGSGGREIESEELGTEEEIPLQKIYLWSLGILIALIIIALILSFIVKKRSEKKVRKTRKKRKRK